MKPLCFLKLNRKINFFSYCDFNVVSKKKNNAIGTPKNGPLKNLANFKNL